MSNRKFKILVVFGLVLFLSTMIIVGKSIKTQKQIDNKQDSITMILDSLNKTN